MIIKFLINFFLFFLFKLAQPIRLLLAYLEIEHEEKRYNLGPPPEFSRKEWLDDKFSSNLDFPNLPYIISDDGLKLTQSNAIMRHFARLHQLDGSNETEKMRIDLFECQISDFKSEFTRICYSPDFEKLKSDYVNSLPAKLQLLSSFLCTNPWVAGSKLSYVDFLFYEFLDVHKAFLPNCLDAFPNLREFVARFEGLPSIQKYFTSSKYMKWPLNNDMAKFGSRYSTL